MYETHPKIISLIKKIINSWTITLEIVTAQGKEYIGPIQVNRGICKETISAFYYMQSV